MKKVLVIWTALMCVPLVKSATVETGDIDQVIITEQEVIEEPETDAIVEAIETSEDVEIIEEVNEITFRVTAYCACEICCGKWAQGRPTDEFGKPIVIGASGDRLIENVSVASPLPFDTEIQLEGVGNVVVHDRTAKWVVEKHGQNILDIYMTDHEAARQFGVKYLKGVVL